MHANNIVFVFQRLNLLVDELLGAVAAGVIEVKENEDIFVHPTILVSNYNTDPRHNPLHVF